MTAQKLSPDTVLGMASGEHHALSLNSDLGSHTDTVCPPTIGNGDYPYHTGLDKNGTARREVSLARKAAVLNAQEQTIRDQREAGNPLISRVNHAQVEYGPSATYPNGVVYFDTDVPNRIASAHFTFGVSPNGTIAGLDPVWREAVLRSGTQTRALLTLSPFSALYGFWLSTIKGGVQQPSLVSGKITAATADQTRDPSGRIITEKPSGGFRKDPHLASAGDSDTGVAIAEKLRALMGDEFTKGNEDKRGLSSIGLGNIGYKQDVALGIAVKDIVRNTTLSLPLVRGIRLGGDTADDIKVRAALIGLYIYVDRLTVSSGLHLRAGCDLYEADSRLLVDGDALDVPTVDEAAELFGTLLEDASSIIGWDGSVYALTGDSTLQTAADVTASEDSE